MDDVVPASDGVPTRPMVELYPGATFLAPDPELRLVTTGEVQPLLAAVHVAFSQHRPLVLSPDAVWITIAQGVAQHVRLNAATLGPRLGVRHEGKKRLAIRGAMPSSREGWMELVGGFRTLVDGELGLGLGRLFTADFTTTTEVERFASEIVLLDAVSPFFEPVLVSICGIPEVTLLGTADDWKKIRARLDVVRELDLAWWIDALAPVVDQLVATAEGSVDRRFWQAIYKPRAAYGADVITGWIARFFPYVRGAEPYDRRNGVLTVPLETVLDYVSPPGEGPRSFASSEGLPGIRTGDVFAGLSEVTLRCEAESGEHLRDVAIEGGLIGVCIDERGALVPRAGYLVGRPPSGDRALLARMGELVERLRAEHATEPPRATTHDELSFFVGLPLELRWLYRTIGGAILELGGVTWRLRPLEEQEIAVVYRHEGDRPGSARLRRWSELRVRLLLDIGADRVLAFGHIERLRFFCLLERSALTRVTEHGRVQLHSQRIAAHVPATRASLAAILEHALAHDGALDLGPEPITIEHVYEEEHEAFWGKLRPK